MRDFRVTTILEGTTEIRSIYPARFVMRHLTKHMQALYTGRIMQILFLIKAMGGANRWQIQFGGRQKKRAGRFAKSIASRTDQTRADSFLKNNAKMHRQKNRRQKRSTNSLRFYRVYFRLFQN